CQAGEDRHLNGTGRHDPTGPAHLFQRASMTPRKIFPTIEAPRAEERPVEDTRHGITRIDEYAWLRADNWQEVFRNPSVLDPAIRTHLEAENVYHTALMEDTAALREKLFAEMKGRIKEDDSSVPMKD